MAIAINPMATLNAGGGFSVISDGYVQGVAMDDPAVRFALAGGVVAATETLPMWGGLPITEHVPLNDNPLGFGAINRATVLANITGFSVFNQAHNGITSPQSDAPLYTVGMSTHFYRLGSGARIAVKMDPALVSAEGGLITQQVSWDYTANQLIAFNTTAIPVKVLAVNVGNSKVIAYDPATGFATWSNNGACALIQI